MSAVDAHSLLFLSCDIVGSTQYKQRTREWQNTFLNFYRQFPQLLGQQAIDAAYRPGFQLWKPIGDELIFTTRVSNEGDVYQAVRIWLDAMNEYERQILDGTGLATKGGAFIATFPGPDSESSIPKDPALETSDKGIVELNDEALAQRSELYLYDYFGPSIDTGFRVLSACTQRHFTLSVEVAWCMAQFSDDAPDGSVEFLIDDVTFLGARAFKGVWNGRDYPVFAVDRHAKDSINVAMGRFVDRQSEASHIIKLCQACSADPDWPSSLFLPTSKHYRFTVEPEDSLAAFRSNSMEGAETLPAGDAGTDALEDTPPL